MSDPFTFWVFLAVLGGTAAVIWLLTGTVMRQEDDLEADERAAEAAWISATIEGAGGDVPETVIEQVLELHRHYLAGSAADVDDTGKTGDPAMDAPPGEASGLRTGR
jgi:hypothetical protein